MVGVDLFLCDIVISYVFQSLDDFGLQELRIERKRKRFQDQNGGKIADRRSTGGF